MDGTKGGNEREDTNEWRPATMGSSSSEEGGLPLGEKKKKKIERDASHSYDDWSSYGFVHSDLLKRPQKTTPHEASVSPSLSSPISLSSL